jgi:hypothetical protein
MTDPKKIRSAKRQQHGDIAAIAAGNTKVTNSKKKKSNNNNNDVRKIDFVESVSSVIVQFLSTPNLVAFSGCNKACKSAVQVEVMNRKERIAKMNTRVKELLGLTGYPDNDDSEDQLFHRRLKNPFIPTRANVLEAESICEEAKTIIDTDMNWQDLINSVGRMGGELYLSSNDKLFKEERELLKSERDLRILPMNFYHDSDGSEPSQNLEEQHITTARTIIVEYINVYVRLETRVAPQNLLSASISEYAYQFTYSDSSLHALRFAAREQLHCCSPSLSRACLHCLIERVEEIRRGFFVQLGGCGISV